MRGRTGTGSFLCAASEINCAFRTVEYYQDSVGDHLVSAENIGKGMFHPGPIPHKNFN